MSPLAKLFEGNPYEELVPPAPDGDDRGKAAVQPQATEPARRLDSRDKSADTPHKYPIPFSGSLLEELESLPMGLFELEYADNEDVLLPRMRWLALAYIALGKAGQIRNGGYNMGDKDDEENEQWAEDLEKIADAILFNFRPGDGRI